MKLKDKVNKFDLIYAFVIGIPILMIIVFYGIMFAKDIKTGFASVGVTTVGIILSLIIGVAVYEVFDLWEEDENE